MKDSSKKIKNTIIEIGYMNKQKIIYFPDFRYGMSKEQKVVAALKVALPDYNIVSLDLTSSLEIFEGTECKIEEVLRTEQPDIVLADGLGGFFAHTLAGYNRICVNPILSASQYINESYRAVEKQQFSYDRVPDKKNNTYCWGIFGI